MLSIHQRVYKVIEIRMRCASCRKVSRCVKRCNCGVAEKRFINRRTHAIPRFIQKQREYYIDTIDVNTWIHGTCTTFKTAIEGVKYWRRILDEVEVQQTLTTFIVPLYRSVREIQAILTCSTIGFSRIPIRIHTPYAYAIH